VYNSVGKHLRKVYSVLVKWENGKEEEVYRVQLPGPMRLGEGKPENQNHALIFTRGDGVQAIDMNQVHRGFDGCPCSLLEDGDGAVFETKAVIDVCYYKNVAEPLPAIFLAPEADQWERSEMSPLCDAEFLAIFRPMLLLWLPELENDVP
jgi:hypothetical protein